MFKKLPQKLFPCVKYHGLFLSINILLNTLFLLLSPFYLIDYKHQLTVTAQKITYNNPPKVASSDYGSNKECFPLEPNDCEFYEVCVAGDNITTPGHCKFNDNWRNALTDDEKLQLREAFGTYGLDLSLFSTDPRERLALGNYISLIPPRPALPVNWQISRETVKKAIYGTYPQLSPQEKDEIVYEFEKAWWNRQNEVLEVEMNGLMIAWNIAAIPETLGTGFAIKDGLWQLIKNPTARSKIVVQLKKIPEAITSLRKPTVNSPVALSQIVEIDSERIIQAVPIETRMDTLTLLKLRSKGSFTSFGRGATASVYNVSKRMSTIADQAKTIIRNAGGVLHKDLSIEIARSFDDFYFLYNGNDKTVGRVKKIAGFSLQRTHKIILNPEYSIRINENSLLRLITHELTHEASELKGFSTKLTKLLGVEDKRIWEGFTDYTAARLSGTTYDVSSQTYLQRVLAVRNTLYQYCRDWLKIHNYPQTDINLKHVYNQLFPHVKDYLFTDSTVLEQWFDQLYGPGKFAEWLKYFFNGVAYVPSEKQLAYYPISNYSLFSINNLIKRVLPQKTYAVAADLSSCCRDWPDEGNLKTPFLNALQTSEDLKIYEWSPENFEALIKLEFLRDRLNSNQVLTSRDFQDLRDEDIHVEADEIKLPEAIDIETLPVATADIFAPLPQTEPDTNIIPPDNDKNINTLPTVTPFEPSQDGQSDNQPKEKIIVGNCNMVDNKNPWICEWPDHSWQNCLDAEIGNQSLFNDTYCPGSDNKGPELMWKYQAALAHGGNGTECGGEIQNQLPNCEPNSQ